ncbi:MAG: hypothetical protein ACXW5U_04890 [Thermoanaerobaculia bacterium]
MKRLIVFAVLLFIPLLASGDQGDTLLTPDGTLYTIQFERAEEHPEVTTVSAAYLTLTARRGDTVTREIVPATLVEKGAHFNPAIAFDVDSGMLFAFWIHNSSMLSNQLMFASRDAEGVWGEAASFGALYDFRRNLRLAVTRKYEDANGELQSGLSVHLAWWEFDFTTGRNSARYALATIDEGRVAGIQELDLDQFLPENLEPATEPIDESVINQPVLFPSPRHDSVLLVFGDLPSGTLHTLRILPKIALNGGRLRVPGGKREAGFRAPTLNAGDSRIEGVYGDDDRLALYANENGKLRYVLLKNGQWSVAHAISLDEQLTSSAAVDALRRLVSDH